MSTLPIFRIWEFLLGIVVAQLVRRGAVRRRPPVIVPLGLLVVILVASDLTSAAHGLASTAPGVVAALVVCACALDDLTGRRPNSFLAGPLADRLGNMSYAFYLVQLIPIEILRHGWGAPDGWVERAVWAVTWFVATFLLADVLHRCVERPAMRRLTGR